LSALGYTAVGEQFSIAQRMGSVPPPGRPASRSVLYVGRRSERGGGLGEYRCVAAGHDRSGRRGSRGLRCRGRCAGFNASGCGFGTCSPSGSHIRVATCNLHFGFDRASGPATARVSGSQWFHRRVAGSRCVPPLRLGNIYEPNGLAVCNVEQPWRYGSILLRGDPWSRSSGEPGLRGGL
jgi:hypothetical protein